MNRTSAGRHSVGQRRWRELPNKFFPRTYDPLINGLERAGLRERRHRLLRELSGDILEIGAGTGLNLPHYERATHLVLLEPDRHMRERLQRRLDQASAPATVVAGVAEELPFPDTSFDAVVATLVFCSLDDPGRALTEIHRVLKPDGKLVLIEHVRASGARGKLQDALSPIHARLGAGCRPNRRTADLVRAASFALDEQPFVLRGNLDPLTRNGLQGTAHKRA
jgi:ubiquinone/menaquinone biosynthesis C-methylase UbiE